MTDPIPYWHFDENLMVFSDGSFGAGFRITGYDINCKSDEEINQFSLQVENFLKSLNPSIRLQLFHKISPDVSITIDKHKSISCEMNDSTKLIANRRIVFLENRMKEKKFFQSEIYLFVRSSSAKQKKEGFFSSPQKFMSMVDSEYQAHRDAFIKNKDQILNSLSGLGLNPVQIAQEEWTHLIYEYFNLEKSEYLGTPFIRDQDALFSEPLYQQLCATDIAINHDGLRQGKYFFKTITLKTLPEGMTYSGMIDSLTKLPYHYWILQNIKPLDQGKEKSKLGIKRRIAHAMSSGSKNISDIESETNFSSLDDLLRELTEGSEKLISFDLNIIIWDEELKKLDEKSEEVLKLLRTLNQADGVVETFATWDTFLRTAVGTANGHRHKTVKASNLAHMIPLFSPWLGNDKPVCLIPNRDGALFALDPFDKNLPNWNGIVFGGSGSGKSFTVGQLMLMFYTQKEKPRIIWIDNGASSKRIVESLDGEFLDLSLNSPFTVNMFDLPDGEVLPTPDKVKMILAVLELVLKDEDRKFLPKREKALLEEVIFTLYKNAKETPTLSFLREKLLEHSALEMNKYGEILYSWTGDTAYGRILDRKSTITLKKDLTSIEVQSLNDHPELKDVMLLLLTSYIQDISTKDFKRPYLLIVDEAERLFQTELARQFVITCYRTWRKFNSGIWALSQNYKDFLRDKNLSDSLLPNTTSLIVLRQRKIDWEDFRQTFDFNEAQVNAIKSLEVVKGKYSEFFYMQDEKQALLRLIPEPLSYWICTSDGNDKSIIEQTRKQNPDKSLLEVLEDLAAKRL